MPLSAPHTADAPLIERVLRPFQSFIATEAASGILLLLSMASALALANSPMAAAFHHLWEVPFTVGIPGHSLTMSLHGWVNDGFMAVFFFLVGLEIKREVLVGDLSTRRSATLPVAAALGGMLVPAVLYFLLNGGGEGSQGWGIPMATDIAFALGVLALLGRRAPSGLRVFLAALAIADDLGAVIVIAIFYSSALDWTAVGGALGMFVLLLLLNVTGVRRPLGYAIVGLALWTFVRASGIHATIAGVLLALAVPARRRISEDEFLARADAALAEFRAADQPGQTVLTNRGHQEALAAIEEALKDAQAPLQRMEHALRVFVAFVIMPLFALANAGVPLGDAVGAAAGSSVAWGIVVGLVLGKPAGILLASYAAVRARAADLPANVGWRHVHGAGWLGGIGFTMSLFIAGLAFGEGELLDVAKIGVLAASVIAGLTGYAVLRFTPAAPAGADMGIGTPTLAVGSRHGGGG